MKINTDCGVIYSANHYKLVWCCIIQKTAGKACLLVFSTCLSSVLHSVYFKFINIFKNRQEYCCKTFWCPSESFIKCLKRSSCFEEHTVSLIYGPSTNVCVLLWCVWFYLYACPLDVFTVSRLAMFWKCLLFYYNILLRFSSISSYWI